MSKDFNKKNNKSRAIRRLVIWYKRNSAVTSIVDTATSSAATATNVAGNVVSGAGSVVSTASSVVSSAGSLAKNTLQPLVFDPLKRLQNNENQITDDHCSSKERVWIAVDAMGGDHAPGPILEGCLDAISRFPINIKFVGQIKKIKQISEEIGLREIMDKEIENNRLELVASGPPIGMNE